MKDNEYCCTYEHHDAPLNATELLRRSRASLHEHLQTAPSQVERLLLEGVYDSLNVCVVIIDSVDCRTGNIAVRCDQREIYTETEIAA